MSSLPILTTVVLKVCLSARVMGEGTRRVLVDLLRNGRATDGIRREKRDMSAPTLTRFYTTTAACPLICAALDPAPLACMRVMH